MKIVVCDPISPKGIALLQQRPEFQVVVLPKRLPEAELLPVVADAVALVVRSETKVTRKVIEAAPKLRVVGRAGVGVDNVDIEAATQHGTVVMNTPGGNTVTTAELSFAMLLSLARKVPQAHASMVAGKWDRKLFQGAELHGQNARRSRHGPHRHGSRQTRASPSACASSPTIRISPKTARKAIGAEFADSVDDVYRAADFITVHMPVTPETKHMLNAAAFAKMKPGVKIVNCARGEIIAENDLIAALESGKVAGAALDVFAVEPLPADHPFRKQPNLILTPHLGASTEEAQEKCGIEVAEVIAGYLLTGEVRNAVNLPYLDAKTYEQVKPYLPLGEALGKLVAQLSPASADRLYITYGGNARQLPNIDPVTRAMLRGFLSEQQFEGREQRQRPHRRREHRHHRRGKEIGRAGDVQRMGARPGFQQREEIDFGGRDVFRLAEQSAHRAAVQHAGGDSRQRHAAAAEQQGPARHRRLSRHAAGQAQGQHRQHEPGRATRRAGGR